MLLRLAFWNCGVAPSRTGAVGKRCPDEVAVVLDSVLKSGVELIALCEVDERSVDAIRKAMKARGVRKISLASQQGLSRWDLAIFYKPARLQCRAGKKVLAKDSGRTIRAGYQVKVTIKGETDFDLYLLHWHSRLYGGYKYREYAAQELSSHITKRLGKKHDRRTVVLGDFNDEPFDVPLTKLKASRDPALVQSKPTSYLYNPTWWLACPTPDNPWERFGSYDYSSGSTSRRYLFDQALTSAHFLDQEHSKAPVARLLFDALDGLEQPSATADHIPLELTLA